MRATLRDKRFHYANNSPQPLSRERKMTRLLFAFVVVAFLGSAACADVAELLKMGLAARSRGDVDAAIYYFTQAIDTRSLGAADLAVVMNSRGVAYEFKGEIRKAIGDFDAAIRIMPNFADAYINRGFAWTKVPDYERAIADFTEATKHDSKNAYMALSNRAGVHSEKGDFHQAIRDYDEAIQLRPDYAGAYYGRADAYRGKGDYEGAIENYGRAIQLVPTFADAHINLGVTHQQQGAIEKAIEDFSAAIRI
jgi:tetratricopeptide (TPR) repeat protein